MPGLTMLRRNYQTLGIIEGQSAELSEDCKQSKRKSNKSEGSTRSISSESSGGQQSGNSCKRSSRALPRLLAQAVPVRNVKKLTVRRVDLCRVTRIARVKDLEP